MQVAMGGTLYILYSIAGKLIEIFVNHFGGHISMDPFGHLSMESLIGVPYVIHIGPSGGTLIPLYTPISILSIKKLKNVLTESLSMCIIYIISSYQRVTHN